MSNMCKKNTNADLGNSDIGFKVKTNYHDIDFKLLAELVNRQLTILEMRNFSDDINDSEVLRKLNFKFEFLSNLYSLKNGYYIKTIESLNNEISSHLYKKIAIDLFNISNYVLDNYNSINFDNIYTICCKKMLDMLRNYGEIMVKNRIVSIEGERCSGKDTLINNLKNSRVLMDSIYFAPRLVENIAWRKLNELKKNCYFNIGNNLAEIILWFSDLAFKMAGWLQKSGGRTILLNRYIHSAIVCSLGRLRKSDTYELLRNIEVLVILSYFFTMPDKTIMFKIDIEELENRMKISRNRELSKEEKDICENNILWFDSLVSNHIIRVDSLESEEDILKIVEDKIKDLNNIY